MDFPAAIQDEIARISEKNGVSAGTLENFAKFVILQVKPPKPLSMTKLKQAVYKYFGVGSTETLKKSSEYKMSTDGLGKLNFGRKASWELLYREFIGVLPHEDGEAGYGCINGIDIFLNTACHGEHLA